MSNIKRGASKIPVKKEKVSYRRKVKENKESIILNIFSVIKVLIVILSFVLLYEIWFYLIKPIVEKPIDNVLIDAHSQELDVNKINTIVYEETKDHSIFNLDMKRIQDRINALEWVKSTYIKRSYPSKVEVDVEFQNPIAKWGENLLLSDENNIYSVTDIENYNDLPSLYASDINRKKILDNYHLFSAALRPLKTQINTLYFSDRGSLMIVLDNNIMLNLGKEEHIQRLKNFISVYQKELINRANEIEYIDLRYRSGLAVKFKENIIANKI